MRLYYHNSIETFNTPDHNKHAVESCELYHLAIYSKHVPKVYYI